MINIFQLLARSLVYPRRRADGRRLCNEGMELNLVHLELEEDCEYVQWVGGCREMILILVAKLFAFEIQFLTQKSVWNFDLNLKWEGDIEEIPGNASLPEGGIFLETLK